MAAVICDIADAVVTALNAGTFSTAIDPVRSYATWEETLEDTGTLHVDVVPLQTTPTSELSDRGQVEYSVSVDIGVRYRFGVSEQESSTGHIDKAEIDPFVLLVQEIGEYFMTDRLADATTAVWQSTDIKLSWSRKHLREMRQFFGFLRLTFTAHKAFA